MTKRRLEFRKLAAIAICLVGITVFSGCDKDEDPNNNNGTEQPSEQGKPSVVTNFTATAGNGQVRLSWSAPSNNGGSAITGYEVTMDNWANKVTIGQYMVYHIYTGLSETPYTFKVRALNANGAGTESTQTATPDKYDERFIGTWTEHDPVLSGRYVFNSNGTYEWWEQATISGGPWVHQTTGTWGTSNSTGRLTLTHPIGGNLEYTFTVSSSQLTLTSVYGGDVWTYTKE